MEPASSWVTHPWVAEGAHRVRFGVMAGPINDWPRLRAFAARAEELGFDSYWTIDHPVRAADWATNLAALAVSTRTMRLGTLVSCVYYRDPVLIARQAADVDRLSGGRLVLGLGIGDSEPEFAKMGLSFPPPRERQVALDEAVRIVRGVWCDEPFTLEGTRFRVAGANVRPGPVQEPRVPLLIAGGGEQVTLRKVARYADLSNFGEGHSTGGAATLDDVRRKLAALDGHLAAEGRTPDSVLRSHVALPCVLAGSMDGVRAKFAALPEPYRAFGLALLDTPRDERAGFVGTPREATDYFCARAAAGLRYFVVRIVEDDRETLDLLAERVIPAVVGASGA